jgi:hypothetical protein
MSSASENYVQGPTVQVMVVIQPRGQFFSAFLGPKQAEVAIPLIGYDESSNHLFLMLGHIYVLQSRTYANHQSQI